MSDHVYAETYDEFDYPNEVLAGLQDPALLKTLRWLEKKAEPIVFAPEYTRRIIKLMLDGAKLVDADESPCLAQLLPAEVAFIKGWYRAAAAIGRGSSNWLQYIANRHIPHDFQTGLAVSLLGPPTWKPSHMTTMMRGYRGLTGVPTLDPSSGGMPCLVWNGAHMSWHKNGQLATRARMVAGRRHGIRTQWDENGQIVSRANFYEDACDGGRVTYYGNGLVRSITRFKRGVQHGWSLEFADTDDNRLLSAELYRDGADISIRKFTSVGPIVGQFLRYPHGQQVYFVRTIPEYLGE